MVVELGWKSLGRFNLGESVYLIPASLLQSRAKEVAVFKEPELKTASTRKPQKPKAKTPQQEPGKKANLGETYKDYVQFAEQLQREAIIGSLPFWILGVLGTLFRSQLGNYIATTLVRLDLAKMAGEIGDYRLQLLLMILNFKHIYMPKQCNCL